MITMKKIGEIPKIDRPREKLINRGVESLTDHELIAVLLGSGSKKRDVMSVAGEILKVIDLGKEQPDIDEMQKIEGVGPVKAAILAAALEFARRRIKPAGTKISVPSDVVPLINHLSDRKQEHFICISLNGANEVISNRIVSIGLVNRTQVHPREVFADPITDRASSVIVAHNHPSGELSPSVDDIEITNLLKNSGEILGISLLDHIIFSHKGYYSFMDNNEL